MTVSYQHIVVSSTSGGFIKLLGIWHGSLYKLIYRELLLFIGLFVIISGFSRNCLSEVQLKYFENVVVYCDKVSSHIPLSFVLGFYVTYLATRWWQQYITIPSTDDVMYLVSLYVEGNDEYGEIVRRSFMRYLNLSFVLLLRFIGPTVRRRFHTLETIVETGFMTQHELELLQSIPNLESNTYLVPSTWFINLLKEIRHSERISVEGQRDIIRALMDFRSKCSLLLKYNSISIPLVYTQVVTIGTYGYFIFALIGRQFIEMENKKTFQMEIDKYFPLFTIFEFLFFMGLLKVAEQLINPFGDDEEDFDLNLQIDRHMKISYIGVDTLIKNSPPLDKNILSNFSPSRSSTTIVTPRNNLETIEHSKL